jgi:hypothetical protein
LGSLLRATTLFGYGDLVRELGGDPELYLSRFRIPRGIETQEDAFISFDAYARMLEASAEGLGCPDFGLRLSNWQGLHTLGPIAVIARNAQTLLGGVEAIARYLNVHSPALKLTPAPRTPHTALAFTYEVTEPGLPDVVQTYEISMAIAVRIIRLLGGPEARPNVTPSCTTNRAPTRRTAKRWVAACVSARPGVGSSYPTVWPTDASRARIRRPDGLRRNTLSPTIFLAPRRCPTAWQS